MKKRLLSLILVLSIVLSNFCLTISYAGSVQVTTDNLKTALQNLVKANVNGENYKFDVSNNVISVSVDNEKYSIQYDLSGKPTFMQVAEIKKGMSYEEFEKATSNLSLPMLGYLAVANIEGANFEDSTIYFTMYILASAFSELSDGTINLNDSYMIVSDNAIVEDDSRTIKESEFGNRVIEYTKALYGKSTKFNDEENGINSFEWIQDLEDITDDSCKIVTKLIVNIDADFSQLNGISEQMGGITGSGDNDDTKEQTPNTPKLTDIAGTRCESAVKKLVELGIVNGFEDNTFRPTENVTRAQFAKMLVEAKNLKLNNGNVAVNFSDLSESHWANNYIKIAVDNGIINGYPDNTFKPDNPVTFAEAMAMILRAMKLEASMTDKSWPMGYINEAKKVGILDSVDYSDPNVPANRSETAISLYNMINITDKQFSSMLNATYTSDNGTITLKEVEDGEIEFDFYGKSMGTDWSLGTTIHYSNGVASTDDEFFEYINKVRIEFNDGYIVVEASSTDPESGYNGINGIYKIKK